MTGKVQQDEKKLLALVMEKYDDQKQLKVRFFHPAGSSPSFSFPRRLDELVISYAQVFLAAWIGIGSTAYVNSETMHFYM